MAPKIVNTPMVAAFFNQFFLQDCDTNQVQKPYRLKKNSKQVSRQPKIETASAEASTVSTPKAKLVSPRSPTSSENSAIIGPRKRSHAFSQSQERESKSSATSMLSETSVDIIPSKHTRASSHNQKIESKSSTLVTKSSARPGPRLIPVKFTPREQNNMRASSRSQNSEPMARTSATITPPERGRASHQYQDCGSKSSTSIRESCVQPVARTSAAITPVKLRRASSQHQNSQSKSPTSLGKPMTAEKSTNVTSHKNLRSSSQCQRNVFSTSMRESPGEPMARTSANITLLGRRRSSPQYQSNESKSSSTSMRESSGEPTSRISTNIPDQEHRLKESKSSESSTTPVPSLKPVDVIPPKLMRLSSQNQNSASKSSMPMRKSARKSVAGTLVNNASREQKCQSPQNNKTRKSSHSNAAGTNKIGTFVLVKDRPEIGLITRCDPTMSEYHVRWFIRSTHTILDDMGDRQELFLTDECGNVKYSQVKRGAVEVHRLSQTARYDEESEYSDWKKRSEKSGQSFFYQKKYVRKFGRFEDIPADDDDQTKNPCYNCAQQEEQQRREVTVPVGEIKFDKKTKQYVVNELRYRDQVIRRGCDIFLTPVSLQLPYRMFHDAIHKKRQDEVGYDEDEYPEKYRKKDDRAEKEFAEPLDVGRVCKIFSNTADFNKEDTYLRVRKYYRPYNTCLLNSVASRENLNLLYWSDEEGVVSCDKILGKCFVAYEKNTDVAEWCGKGPFRFYVRHKYNDQQETFLPLSKSDERHFPSCDPPIDWPVMKQPLATMDIFSGAGGLSTGLQQSGVAVVKWAVDCEEPAVKTFEKNNPRCEIYINKCEDQLEAFKRGKGPRPRGEVQLLCGGPSTVRSSEVSSFDDSQIGTFCSYVEYFRPRYVLFENVRKFVAADRSKVLRMTLKRLIEAGYQVTIGLLQCGNYGVPQSRHRVVILAAAPGEDMPKFPEPTHAFFDDSLKMKVENTEIVTDVQWSSGPYRAMTVADAISDLPPIEQGDESTDPRRYMKEPETQFQKEMRGSASRADDVLSEHVCRKLTPLHYGRIHLIPALGDWRDLPNRVVTLSNGAKTCKLVYTHKDSNGLLRGVCSCATREDPAQKKPARPSCEKRFKQNNTVIPWCLAHTGNRSAHWKGLYGRLANDSYFRTIGTIIAPMGQTGRVVHPTEDRILSVRECARAQGFPDSYEFPGTIGEKHELIGNAFPPPVAKAIGRSLIYSCCQRRSEPIV